MLYSLDIVAFGNDPRDYRALLENSLIFFGLSVNSNYRLITTIATAHLTCASECLTILYMVAELLSYHMTLGHTIFILPSSSTHLFHLPAIFLYRFPLLFSTRHHFYLFLSQDDIAWHLLYLTETNKTRSFAPPLLVD